MLTACLRSVGLSQLYRWQSLWLDKRNYSHSLIMLSHQFPSQDEVDEDAGNKRKVVIRLCELLAPQDLAEVLKWPFTVGEAETLVLASLGKQTGKQFAGDVWKFVEQATALKIKAIGLPAKRPRVEDALKELDELSAGTAHRLGRRWRAASPQ